MRKAWFVYQLGSKHPSPAIIYDKLPDDAAGKSSLKPKIIQKHELPDYVFYMNTEWCYEPEYLLCDEVQLSFNQLCELYPYTGDHYAKPAEVIKLDKTDELRQLIDYVAI